MNYESIKLTVERKIALVTINRPESLNALNSKVFNDLESVFDFLENEKTVNCIIITGSGEKSFVAGADIKEFSNFSQEKATELSKRGHFVFDKIENLSKPVIAAVNGFALGGGLELAMSCHFRVASDNAKMGLPEVTLGVIPGYGGTQRLAQLVGKGRAMEMIMTAGMIDAETAKNYGLVNHVVPQAELLDFTKGIATKITKNSSVAIAKAIEAINANFEDGTNGYEVEIKNFGLSFGTEDFKEGTTAFLEKRKAEFPGK